MIVLTLAGLALVACVDVPKIIRHQERRTFWVYAALFLPLVIYCVLFVYQQYPAGPAEWLFWFFSRVLKWGYR